MFKDLRSCVFNVCLGMVIASVTGMCGIYYAIEKVSNGWYLAQNGLKVLFFIFVVLFLVFYVGLFVTAMIKYQIKKKLCTYTNMKIIFLSYIIFVPLSSMVDRIN